MKNVRDFKIDEWMRLYGVGNRYALEGSYAQALSINNLKSLSTDPALEVFDHNLELSYGPFEGSHRLRERIAALHSTNEDKIDPSNVIITPGSIMANYLILDTICGPGDHVICQYPTYGQLYLVPEFGSVDVSLWKMDQSNNWLPNTKELAGLIRPNTKAIILNSPNNPTVTVLEESFLREVVRIACENSIVVFSDEVFNPLVFTSPKPPSIVNLGYTNTIASGSLSKAFSIPGIRLGWIVTRSPELTKEITTKRDFTTITVSRLDDSVASFALDPAVMPNMMKRNISLCQESVGLLDNFIAESGGRVRWVKPQGSGMAFIQILDQARAPVDDGEFCKRLQVEESICLVPGGLCFSEGSNEDFKGYFRVGLGNPDVLRQALPLLHAFIQKW
ncbi:Aspartate aminotransferase [Colletotrichum fructicola]|nr:Aspartate aminotransferase [Colletotrichum fructicola]